MNRAHDLLRKYPDWSGGDQNAFGYRVATMQIQGNAPIRLPGPGVTAVVGGNNVGKSTLLRQLVTYLANPNQPMDPALLTEASWGHVGTAADLVDWLEHHAKLRVRDEHVVLDRVGPMNTDVPIAHVVSAWLHQSSGAPPTSIVNSENAATLSNLMTQYVDAQQRLGAVSPVQRRASFGDPPINPLHYLEDHPDRLDNLALIVEEAFGERLYLDPVSGNVSLRLGVPSAPVPPVDRITPEYRQAVSDLRRLETQGDGMKSMVGVLLSVLSNVHQVVVIDEPEAYLHPPQARVLGRALGELARTTRAQVVLATHDRNILAGLLDATDIDVAVVRLTRHNDEVSSLQLAPNDLRAVWGNPVLRYSNVLDGLFHRVVVLAENERDCRFYAAALSEAVIDGEVDLSANDVLFVPTAGKTNMKGLVKVLRSCGVPTVVSADIDVLNDEAVLRDLVVELEGDWDHAQPLWAKATAQFRVPPAGRQKREVLAAISNVLNDDPTGPYTKDEQKRISAELKIASSWAPLKEYGQTAFKQDPEAGEKLLNYLDSIGLVLVRVGELEGFAPLVKTAKGLKWAEDAIAAGAHRDRSAREHISRVAVSGLAIEGST